MVEEESFEWYKNAAEQGDAEAQYQLCLIYDIGFDKFDTDVGEDKN